MTANAERLRALIAAHELTRAQVAEILGRQLGVPVSIETVHAWLKPAGNRSQRNIPAAKLRVLERALERRRR